VPSLANIFVGAAEELGVQLKNQYPPEMLASFLESVLADVDTASLARCGSVWGDILGSLLAASPGSAGRLLDTALSSGPAFAAQGVDAIARMLNALEQARPGALSATLSRTMARVDRPTASTALAVAANAFLDQKWHVLSWFYGLVRGRIKKRLGS
jgi:hypothetical protein